MLLLYELPALIIIPLFEKEGPGEISAVTDDFTSAEKSPLIPLCERGKLLCQLCIHNYDTVFQGKNSIDDADRFSL